MLKIMRISFLLKCLLLHQARGDGPFNCASSGACEDGAGGSYACKSCQDQDIQIDSPCPSETDATCAFCTLTASTVSHTFSLDSSASAPVMVESASSLFTATGCATPSSCTQDSSSPGITMTSDAEIRVDVTSLYSTSFQVSCTSDTVTSQASVTIAVECTANSTTLSPTSFPTTVTTDLLPSGTPQFGFFPHTSSESLCPVSTVGSDSVAFDWSSHFVQSTSNNILAITPGERFLRRSLTFFIVFRADGGSTASVPCTLVTQCVSGSVPLDIADYPAQQVELGSGTVYFQSSEILPTVTGCPVQAYHVGSASDHTATPTGLNPSVTTTGGNFRIAPSDATAKQTYQFYIWLELPDAAFSSVGPVELRVGCSNYIDATLVQDTGALTQLIIGSQGTPNKLTFVVDQTNTNTDGFYNLNLIGFSSTKPGACPPDISTYSLSTSNSDSTMTVTQAQLEPYSAGDTNFEVSISTSAVGTFQFYIWGQDSETRWDNVGVSPPIIVQVNCGSETISTSSSTHTEVFYLTTAPVSVAFASAIFPVFTTTKPACPITSFEFYSSPALLMTWSDSLMTLSGSGTAVTGSIDASTAQKKTVYVKGISDGGSSSSLPVDLVVCGNELVSTISSEPILMIADAVGWASFLDINEAQLKSFFAIDASSDSHEDCLMGSISLSVDAACSSPFVGSGLSVMQFPKKLRLAEFSPRTLQTAYFCLTSKGNKVASKMVKAEVCGGETAIVDPTVPEIVLRYARGSGAWGKQTILLTDYNKTLRSNSDFCPLASYSLVSLDEGSGIASPYSGTTATMLSTFDIDISTQQAGISSFYVQGQSTSGSKAFLKFNIEIYEILSEEFLAAINTAPFFDTEPQEVAVEQQPTESTSVSIQLPAVMDSLSNFCGLFIEAEGAPSFFASNSSNITSWGATQAEQSSEFFSYDFEKNLLLVSLPPASKSKVLKLTLVDQNRASTTSLVTLKIVSSAGAAENKIREPASDDIDLQNQADLNPSEIASSSQKSINSIGRSTNFTASIKSLSKYGELTIAFSEKIKTLDIDITSLNASSIDIYVQPALRLADNNYQSTDLNLTWMGTNLDEQELRLQVDWRRPSSLSPGVELDTLVLFFKDEALIVSSETLRALSSRTATAKIPRQMKKTALALAVESAADAAKKIMKGATISAFVFNTLLSGVLNMMLGLINSLQLIVHLPAFNIAFPPNAYMVFETLIPLVTFDLLEAFEEQVAAVLNFLGFSQGGDEGEEEVPQQFQNVGFEAFQPLPNLGTLGVVSLIYFLKLVVFLLSSLTHKLTGKGQQVEDALRKQLFFSEILLIFIEGYLDFCLAAFLFLSWPHPKGWSNWASLAIIALLAFGLIPAALIWIGTLPADRFGEPSFRQKWSVLFEDIRTQDVGQRLFFLAFVLRRFTYVLIAFSLQGHPSLQVVCLNLSNLGILIYQGYFKPIQSHLRNFIEATNEGLMCMACFHLMAFTDLVSDSEAQFLYGWSLAALVGVQIMFNFGIILSVVVQALYQRAHVFFSRFKRGVQGQSLHPQHQRISADDLSCSTPDETPREVPANHLNQQSGQEDLEEITAKGVSSQVCQRGPQLSQNLAFAKQCNLVDVKLPRKSELNLKRITQPPVNEPRLSPLEQDSQDLITKTKNPPPLVKTAKNRSRKASKRKSSKAKKGGLPKGTLINRSSGQKFGSSMLDDTFGR